LFAGGLEIAKKLFVTGVAAFKNTTASTSTTTGAVTVAGGLGVGGNLNVGGTLNVSGIATFSNNVTANGYTGRQGQGGATSNALNTFWTGTAIQQWVDTTNVGTLAFTSDYRTKKDVTDAEPALEQVRRWRPITYTGAKWGVFEENSDVRHSFIAHELQAISPDCVIGEKDGEHVQHLDVLPILARLAKAVQELDAELTALKKVQA
jgi:hypothetical protein